MQNGENGEERKEMYSIMKKSRLLALLAATVFFISEAVSFIQPVAAMAANPKDGDLGASYESQKWEPTTYPRGELGKKYDEKYYPGYKPAGGEGEYESAEEILDYNAPGLPNGLEFTGPFKDDKGAYLRLSGVPEEEGKFTIQMWRKIKSSSGISESGGEQYIQIGEDKDDDDHHDHKPASWELNPNEKRQLVITFTGTPASLAAGYQEQGEAAQALMKAAVPAGWTKAFSFNLLNSQRQPETNLKTGTMTLYIPSEYQKAGRQFALVILDKGGQTYLLSDMDTNPGTITVPLNYEGYAMDLLYKD